MKSHFVGESISRTYVMGGEFIDLDAQRRGIGFPVELEKRGKDRSGAQTAL
jgi:hypothetical protein